MIMFGRATYTRKNLNFHAGVVSHGTRYQIRLDLHGWYLVVLFGPRTRWWARWLWILVRHPSSYRWMFHLAHYNWAHRRCDLEDFHHSLGCDITPERELY